jgi:hypothetical protein
VVGKIDAKGSDLVFTKVHTCPTTIKQAPSNKPSLLLKIILLNAQSLQLHLA